MDQRINETKGIYIQYLKSILAQLILKAVTN